MGRLGPAAGLHASVHLAGRDGVDPVLARALVFAPLLIVTLHLSRLPISAYAHSLSLTYHQSVQGWGSWFLDWLKGLGLEVVAAIFWRCSR